MLAPIEDIMHEVPTWEGEINNEPSMCEPCYNPSITDMLYNPQLMIQHFHPHYDDGEDVEHVDSSWEDDIQNIDLTEIDQKRGVYRQASGSSIDERSMSEEKNDPEGNDANSPSE